MPITDTSAVTLTTGTGGAPTLTLVVGTTERTLTASTSTNPITALTFSYTVVAADTDTDGVSVKANSLTLPSGTTIQDALGNDLVTTFTAVAGGASQTVDNTAPTVGTIAFTTTGPYKTGDTITISVPITDASAVTLAGTGGAPTLTLVVGTTERTLTTSTAAGTITRVSVLLYRGSRGYGYRWRICQSQQLDVAEWHNRPRCRKPGLGNNLQCR